MKKLELEFRQRAKHWRSRGGKKAGKKNYNTALAIIKSFKQHRDEITQLESISKKDIYCYLDRMLQKRRADSTIYEHTLIIEKLWFSVLNNSSKLNFNEYIKLAIGRRLATISENRSRRLEVRTIDQINAEILRHKKAILKLESELKKIFKPKKGEIKGHL